MTITTTITTATLLLRTFYVAGTAVSVLPHILLVHVDYYADITDEKTEA